MTVLRRNMSGNSRSRSVVTIRRLAEIDSDATWSEPNKFGRRLKLVVLEIVGYVRFRSAIRTDSSSYYSADRSSSRERKTCVLLLVSVLVWSKREKVNPKF